MARENDQSIPFYLRPRTTKEGQLFKSKWLEKITRTSLWVPVFMHTIIVIGFVYYAFIVLQTSILTFIPIFLSGLLFWSLAEYWVHRVGYHFPTEAKWFLKVQHMGHGIHHQHPKDTERLAMPPVPALILLSIIFALFWAIGGKYSFLFFPGFLAGYMIYVILHYAQHRYSAPSFKPLNKLWRHHALHHYKYPETKAFGVSTRLWDFVFGTMP